VNYWQFIVLLIAGRFRDRIKDKVLMYEKILILKNLKQMKTLIALLLLFTLSVNPSCQKNDSGPEGFKEIDLDEKSSTLLEADNTFGLKIFQKVREKSDKENIMISPLSISVALTMAYNGAEGDTKKEMQETLELNGLTDSEINGSYKTLINALLDLDDDVIFKIANSVFYADIFTVKPGFLDVNRDIYDAEIRELDFSSQQSVDIINDWVSDNTNGKIPTIINQLNPLDRMLLINAIYFKGTWAVQFDKKGTHDLNFTLKDGSDVKVPMMNKLDNVPYFTNNLFKAVKIPYGRGNYNMVVILPADGKNSQDVIDELNMDNWKEWMGGFEMKERVDITMPRFKFSFDIGLNDILTDMEMVQAFSPSDANFSKITDEDLYISMVLHKSFIDVNETGTEAAAVTVVTFTTTSIGTEPPTIPFLVDKPFVFAITEEDTGAIMFIGEVSNPEY
jgi:serine protease inhibitor